MGRCDVGRQRDDYREAWRRRDGMAARGESWSGREARPRRQAWPVRTARGQGRSGAAMVTYATVPRSWEGQTAVCLGTGPSLCQEDVTYCQGRAKVIAIKDAVYLAPWADVLYGAGADRGHWWPTHGPKLTAFTGRRYTLDGRAAAWADVLRQGGRLGLSSDPAVLHTGMDSGYSAINLASLHGVSTVLLLGYDMQKADDGRTHYHGQHPWQEQTPWPGDLFRTLLMAYDTIVAALEALRVRVVNCSRETALTVFPRLTLREVLS